MSEHHHEKRFEDYVVGALELIEQKLNRLLGLLTLPQGMTITQIGGNMATNNSIQAGSSGVFQETPVPAGSVFPAGTVIAFAADDPAVGIAASPDGDPSKVVVSVPASDTQGSAPAGSPGSFNLAVTATGTANGVAFTVKGTPINVLIISAPSNLPSGMTLAQLS
jgi:hypothetical protein